MIIKREIGEKGQVVIPKDIRNHLGLHVGTSVTFEVRDDEVVLKGERDAVKIVEDFFDTPKIDKKISVEELKRIYEGQYEEDLY